MPHCLHDLRLGHRWTGVSARKEAASSDGLCRMRRLRAVERASHDREVARNGARSGSPAVDRDLQCEGFRHGHQEPAARQQLARQVCVPAAGHRSRYLSSALNCGS
jgi:hypothetical protein